jgi:hypothetical protein
MPETILIVSILTSTIFSKFIAFFLQEHEKVGSTHIYLQGDTQTEGGITEAQKQQLTDQQCHYIIISAIKKDIEKDKHKGYKWKSGDNLVHWQFQLPVGNIELESHYNIEHPIPEDKRLHHTFTADVTYDHNDKIHNKYFTADVEITYHAKIWTSICLSAHCLRLQNPITVNQFRTYIKDTHHFDHYLYDTYGFGCRTWTTKVGLQLKADGYIHENVEDLIKEEVTQLLSHKKTMMKKVSGTRRKTEVSRLEVPNEVARFFTYNTETQSATITE